MKHTNFKIDLSRYEGEVLRVVRAACVAKLLREGFDAGEKDATRKVPGRYIRVETVEFLLSPTAELEMPCNSKLDFLITADDYLADKWPEPKTAVSVRYFQFGPLHSFPLRGGQELSASVDAEGLVKYFVLDRGEILSRGSF